MWTLLFILLLVFLLWPLIRLVAGVHSMRRHINKTYNAQQQRRQHQYNNSTTRPGNRDTYYDPATGKRKVYTATDGEYVDFEEVTDGRKPAATPAEPIVVEEQITDVEYEDIP